MCKKVCVCVCVASLLLQKSIRGVMVGDVGDRCCKVGEDEEMFGASVRVPVLRNGVAPVDLPSSCFT